MMMASKFISELDSSQTPFRSPLIQPIRQYWHKGHAQCAGRQSEEEKVRYVKGREIGVGAVRAAVGKLVLTSLVRKNPSSWPAKEVAINKAATLPMLGGFFFLCYSSYQYKAARGVIHSNLV